MSSLLVVDDDLDLLELLDLQLTAAGYEVSCAVDAGAALAAVERARPDAVLLDRVLPHISGIDVCRGLRARETFSRTPILMMSAGNAEADVREGLAAGADDYLTKPLSPGVVAARIEAAVALRSSPRTPAPRTPTGRPVPAAVLGHLLSSAVALQAEGLLRAAGALSGLRGGTPDGTGQIGTGGIGTGRPETGGIERDARAFGALAAAAAAAGARLPAGVDIGAADPGRPHTAAESVLAGHQALIRVLRELAGAGVAGDEPPWRPVVLDLLRRKEQEVELLRATGARGDLPPEPVYRRGAPPPA